MRIATDIVNSIRNRDDSHLTGCVNGEEFEEWLYEEGNGMEKYKEIEMLVKTKRCIETHDIGGTDFAFYKDTWDISTNGKHETKVFSGITSKANLFDIEGLEPVQRKVYAPKMYGQKAYVTTMKKSDFDLVLQGKKHITEAIKDDYGADSVRFPLPDDSMTVLWNYGSHKIADLHYNFISIPICMGYMDGVVHDGNFDLIKLLEKLKIDENVVDRESICISPIPYYNRTEHQKKSIEFKYLLPQEVYEQVSHMHGHEVSYFIMTEVIKAQDCLRKDCEDC